ncbi:hypothetical protein T08_2480 [Trichinella sp. T8]|nr:hypothetical protein T08_2480 [Trichinella sp. T8]
MHTVDIVDFIDKLSSDIAAHVKLIIYKEACHNFSKYDCYYLKCFLIISLNRLKRAFDIMDLKDFPMSGIFSITCCHIATTALKGYEMFYLEVLWMILEKETSIFHCKTSGRWSAWLNQTAVLGSDLLWRLLLISICNGSKNLIFQIFISEFLWLPPADLLTLKSPLYVSHPFTTATLMVQKTIFIPVIGSVECSNMPGKSNYFYILLQWADIKRPPLPSPSYSTFSLCTQIAC